MSYVYPLLTAQALWTISTLQLTDLANCAMIMAASDGEFGAFIDENN